ncbi:MAG TPA: A/G-specific adenine glycosylase [Pirellulaceae bacterium]|nr:A/G-specific adenine glycosylase [Pirellulaceae bacterium]
MDDTSLPPHFADSRWRRSLATRLLRWFDRHARDLPWRKTRDLYRIWVSEIMLQQTQVVTVIPYYQRFLSAFPNVTRLAAAPEQQVLRLWEGLGYYRRARQLHAAAQEIATVFDGKFPRTVDEVRSLPGIGRYTAGAILSIGLDQRLPILEANTIRVLARLAAFRGDTATAAGKKFLWTAAERLLPTRRCGTFNQALMELGSEICMPKSPACDRCPLAQLCSTRELSLQATIPTSKKRKEYEDVTEAAVVICRSGRVLVRQRQHGERWAGLWDFPRFAVSPDPSGKLLTQIERETTALTGVRIGGLRQLATLKHGVTRFRITLKVFTASAASSRTKDGIWISLAELGNYPLNTTGRKIANLLESQARTAKSPGQKKPTNRATAEMSAFSRS